ncbi:hypothetical protein M513_09981 [Trichuris suis]|uniref:Uncharacterized protein n=1 Tax=Trichuris suis TaxID=68888 RepID=A0A085LW11_9BILA|nr:hypothetical protein M513_09981 [Trichuris suis]
MLRDHAFRKSSFPWILRLHGARCKRFHWQAMIWFIGSGILVVMCSESVSPAQGRKTGSFFYWYDAAESSGLVAN